MAGIFIAYESVSRIIYQKPVGEIGIGVVVMIISVIVTGWLVGYLESVAKKQKVSSLRLMRSITKRIYSQISRFS